MRCLCREDVDVSVFLSFRFHFLWRPNVVHLRNAFLLEIGFYPGGYTRSLDCFSAS